MKTPYHLYILMREDMDSLTAGKACAQAAHAANLFTQEISEFPSFWPDFHKWNGEGHGFGTTLVLGVMDETALWEEANSVGEDCLFGLVKDETYPINDGTVVHTLPVYTCAYVFAPAKCEELSHLSLYREDD